MEMENIFEDIFSILCIKYLVTGAVGKSTALY